MKSLKVALFTYSTKPRGGVVHTLNLAEELARLNHKVHIYALTTGEGFFRQVNVPYTLIPSTVVENETIDDKVGRYIRIYTEYLSSINLNYDIYHAEDCISANALYELRQMGLINFFLRTVHHVDDFTSRSLIDCQLKSIIEPEYIIVVSRYWERQLRNHYSLNPTMINNGVDLEKFRIRGEDGSKEKAKERFSVNGCKVMLSIGGIEPRKNTLSILKAYSIAKPYFKSQGERLVWLIGGGETLFDYRDYRDEFFSGIKTLGLKLDIHEPHSSDGDIFILGAIPHDSINELYRASDVFVFPSVKEGWGLVVLEAMASGVPVVSSNIEPMTEYLIDGDNSILVSPMDYETLSRKIIRVLEETDLRNKLIRNGRKTSEAYSWRNTALRHSEVYRSFLERVS